MHSFVRPNQFVALRLPSDTTKITKLEPNTIVSLGKYGNFYSNQIIGRPFYLTFEILETPGEPNNSSLRIIPAAELHAESLITEGSGEADGEGEEFDPNDEELPTRTNRETVDDASTQTLTLAEIEALKKESGNAGRELIAKLLESHTALDQKTAFSLAKYKLRKRKKYMKRFTVLPMDVSLLTNFMLEEKDAARTMELRDELVGLVGCWANVHHAGNTSIDQAFSGRPNGRYLVVDETGGLLVAAMAERMGILYPHDGEEDEEAGDVPSETDAATKRRRRHQHMCASQNTITVLHANSQPNLSLLKYFGYDQDSPDESHPLYAHLKTVSWMQLLDPSADPIYSNEPAIIPDSELATYKSSKRSMYHRKRSRWARVQKVVDETRAGDFDGLVVATLMEPPSVMKHAVPLLAGSAPVAVYSATIEPLTELVDLYSTPRRTAYITRKRELEQKRQECQQSGDQDEERKVELAMAEWDNEFALDPSLLLAPTLETSRIRPWQVLPGRTHPMMTGRGGAEGYIFHAIRVFPSTANVQAAGNPSRKRRKVETDTPASVASGSGVDVEMKS